MTYPGGVDLAEFAAVLMIFGFAGFIKGVLGFGLPMVSMALLVFVGPVEMALALNSIVQPATNISQFLSARMVRPTIARFWPLLATLAPGVVVGAYFLTSLSEGALLLTVGCFVVSFTILNAFGVTIPVPPKRERRISLGLGFAAGILGALTAANGPIFVMYLVSLKVDRAMFRAALGLLFMVSGAMIATSFLAVGVLDAGRIVLALICIPAALAGMWGGNRLGERLANDRFRYAVLAGLFVLGMNFVLRGMGVV